MTQANASERCGYIISRAGFEFDDVYMRITKDGTAFCMSTDYYKSFEADDGRFTAHMAAMKPCAKHNRKKADA